MIFSSSTSPRQDLYGRRRRRRLCHRVGHRHAIASKLSEGLHSHDLSCRHDRSRSADPRHNLAILRRGLRGVPLFRGDASHIHHRLLDLGHSTRHTVIPLYLLCLTLSLAGLIVFWTQGHALPIVPAALFIGSISLARYLGMGTDLSNVRKQVAQASEWRGTVRRSHRLSEYLLSELPHCRDETEFWKLFDHAAERLGFVADGSTREATKVVSVQTQGNPALSLRYLDDLQSQQNWWGMADCLYPAFAAAMLQWFPQESAHTQF